MLSLWASVTAFESVLTNENSLTCVGMYGSSDEGLGEIRISLSSFELKVINLQYLIFEHGDDVNVGFETDDTKHFICDNIAMEMNYCNSKQRGSYIVKEGADLAPDASIRTGQIVLIGQDLVVYPVTRDGYYCVSLYSEDKFRATVHFANSYGYLIPHSIKGFRLYQVLTWMYVVITILYGAGLFKFNKRSILSLHRVHKYFLGLLLVLTFCSIIDCSAFSVNNSIRHSNSTDVVLSVIVATVLTSLKWCIIYHAITIFGSGVPFKSVVPKLDEDLKKKFIELSLMLFVAMGYFNLAAYNNMISDDTEVGMFSMQRILSCLIWVALTGISYHFNYKAFRNAIVLLREKQLWQLCDIYTRLFYVFLLYPALFIVGEAWVFGIDFFLDPVTRPNEEWKLKYYAFDFIPGVLLMAATISMAIILRPQALPWLPLTQKEPEDIELGPVEPMFSTEDLETPKVNK